MGRGPIEQLAEVVSCRLAHHVGNADEAPLKEVVVRRDEVAQIGVKPAVADHEGVDALVGVVLDEDAVGLAVGVAAEEPIVGIGSVACDPGEGERDRIADARVAIRPLDVDGLRSRYPVEVVPGRGAPLGEERLIVSPPLDPSGLAGVVMAA